MTRELRVNSDDTGSPEIIPEAPGKLKMKDSNGNQVNLSKLYVKDGSTGDPHLIWDCCPNTGGGGGDTGGEGYCYGGVCDDLANPTCPSGSAVYYPRVGNIGSTIYRWNCTGWKRSGNIHDISEIANSATLCTDPDDPDNNVAYATIYDFNDYTNSPPAPPPPLYFMMDYETFTVPDRISIFLSTGATFTVGDVPDKTPCNLPGTARKKCLFPNYFVTGSSNPSASGAGTGSGDSLIPAGQIWVNPQKALVFFSPTTKNGFTSQYTNNTFDFFDAKPYTDPIGEDMCSCAGHGHGSGADSCACPDCQCSGEISADPVGSSSCISLDKLITDYNIKPIIDTGCISTSGCETPGICNCNTVCYGRPPISDDSCYSCRTVGQAPMFTFPTVLNANGSPGAQPPTIQTQMSYIMTEFAYPEQTSQTSQDYWSYPNKVIFCNDVYNYGYSLRDLTIVNEAACGSSAAGADSAWKFRLFLPMYVNLPFLEWPDEGTAAYTNRSLDATDNTSGTPTSLLGRLIRINKTTYVNSGSSTSYNDYPILRAVKDIIEGNIKMTSLGISFPHYLNVGSPYTDSILDNKAVWTVLEYPRYIHPSGSYTPSYGIAVKPSHTHQVVLEISSNGGNTCSFCLNQFSQDATGGCQSGFLDVSFITFYPITDTTGKYYAKSSSGNGTPGEASDKPWDECFIWSIDGAGSINTFDWPHGVKSLRYQYHPANTGQGTTTADRIFSNDTYTFNTRYIELNYTNGDQTKALEAVYTTNMEFSAPGQTSGFFYNPDTVNLRYSTYNTSSSSSTPAVVDSAAESTSVVTYSTGLKQFMFRVYQPSTTSSTTLNCACNTVP